MLAGSLMPLKILLSHVIFGLLVELLTVLMKGASVRQRR